MVGAEARMRKVTLALPQYPQGFPPSLGKRELARPGAGRRHMCPDVPGSTAEIRVVDDLGNCHLLARTQRDDLLEPERVPEVGRLALRLTGLIDVPNDVGVLPD